MSERLLRLRSDLIVHAESDGARTLYVVKDPLTGRFFRLRAPEHYMLTRADGGTSIAEAARLTEERFGIKLRLEVAHQFFERMERLLFFEGPALERYRNNPIHIRRRSLWMIPIKAFDPDAALSRWVRRLRFLFAPGSVVIVLLLMAGATAIASSQQSLWQSNLADIWRLTSIPLVLAAIFVIAIVHEFGHALTLKYYGGSIHEMGFLLLYFQPSFYSNISDSYLLSGRRPRVYVGLAGLFFQGLLTAVAVFMWRVVEPGNWLSDFLWVIPAISLLLFLFNLNPLIKLDGYYLLVDALGIPNLRDKSFAYWRGVIHSWLWGRARTLSTDETRHRLAYRIYGIASALYTGALVGWLGYHAVRFLHGHWGLAGVLLLFASVMALAMTSGSAKSDTRAESSGDGAEDAQAPTSLAKPIVVWGTIILVVALSFVIKLERRVGSHCEVEASARYTVSNSASGTIETELFISHPQERRERSVVQANAADFSVIAYELRAAPNQPIARGDTLLVISSNRYRALLMQKTAERDRIIAERSVLVSGPQKDRILQLRAELSELEAQVGNKQAELDRGQRLLDRQLIAQEQFDARRTEREMAGSARDAKQSELDLLIAGPKAEELAVKEAQIAALDAEVEFLQIQIASSTILSPIEGIVTRVEHDRTLVEVADLDPVRLRLYVDQDDIADVGHDAPVSLKVRSRPRDTFHGRVITIASRADTASSQREFLVTTELDNAARLLQPGMTGYAKVACGKRPILSLVARRLMHFIRVEFWSWW
ncbi:MAG TPA: efflux RND transporter periplasmic adaptor subunit [candidate division Zixibacteria bacterium]